MTRMGVKSDHCRRGRVSLQKLGGEKFGAVQAAKGGTGPCNAPGNSRANGISVNWEI